MEQDYADLKAKYDALVGHHEGVNRSLLSLQVSLDAWIQKHKDLSEFHQATVATMEEQRLSQLAALGKTHEAMVHDLQVSHATQVNELKAEHAELLKVIPSLKEAHAWEIQATRQEHGANVKELHEAHNKRVLALCQEIALLREPKELRDLRAKHEDEIKQAREKLGV